MNHPSPQHARRLLTLLAAAHAAAAAAAAPGIGDRTRSHEPGDVIASIESRYATVDAIDEPHRIQPLRVISLGVNADAIPGTIKPWREVSLGAPSETLLASLAVEEGEKVREGQPIATMDDRVERAQVAAAEQQADRRAQLERAKVGVRIATVIAERVLRAHERGAAGNNELDEAVARLDTAKADLLDAQEAVAIAERDLALARARLERLTVRAPFDGVVTRIDARPGTSLSNGDPIVHLVERGTFRAELRLPELTAASLDTGDRVALTLAGSPRVIVEGELRFVEPRVEPASATVRAIFRVRDPGNSILAGRLVRPASHAEAAILERRRGTAVVDVPTPIDNPR